MIDKYELPIIGEIDSADLCSHYDGIFMLKDREIKVDLSFKSEDITEKALDDLKDILLNLSDLESTAYKGILTDLEIGDSVGLYFNLHLEVFSKEEIEELLGFPEELILTADKLLSLINFYRIVIYVDEKDLKPDFVFEYIFGEEYLHHLLVVVLDKEFNVDCVTIES